MATPNPDTLADPNATLFNMSCFDLLLIELVPLAERMARSYEASLDRPSATSTSTTNTNSTAAGNRRATTSNTGAGAGAAKNQGGGGGGTPSSAATPTSNTTTGGGGGTNSNSPASGGNPNPGANADPTANGPASATGTAHNAALLPSLAADGLPETEIFRDSVYVRLERLGFRVGQGLCERFSRDRPRFTDQLDVIKFICKDLWTVVFKKQIDNLKTNHRVRLCTC